MFAWLFRIWFPLALGGLFLLALPGVVLVILAALKLDEPVNAWLQENVQITYHLALAPWVVLFLCLVPLAIILLYFLKLKRKPIQVPSTFLWRKSIEDLHVNALFQWLRQNLLLLLQLLVVLFLIYSTLGLRFHGSSTQGRHYILLIDNSASMAAKDVRPSRLEWAKQEALKAVDAAGDGDFGMVIAFNSKATTVQAYTNNRAKLREAVRSIEQTQRVTRLEEALTLIDGLANPVRATEDVAVRPEDEKPGEERAFVRPQGISTTVQLFSDGRFARLAESTLANLNSRQAGNTSLLGNIHLLYHRAGTDNPGNANNLAIVSFNAVRTGSKDKNQETQRLEAMVRVQNFRNQPAQVTLRLEVLVEGKLTHTDQQVLELGPRIFKKGDFENGEEDQDTPGEILQKSPGQKSGIFVLPPLDLQSNIILHAYLDRFEDDFSLDDKAWYVVGTTRKAKVVIVSPGNPILENFFEVVQAAGKSSHTFLTPQDLTGDAYRKLARGSEVDLVIFDRCAPADEGEMPQANTFFIGLPPPPWQRGNKTVKNPYLILSRTNHPILRHIASLWDIGVAEAMVFDVQKNLDEKVKQQTQLPETDPQRRLLPTMTKLMETSGAVPMLFSLPREPYKDLVLAFPLLVNQGDLNTNWPAQTSFPLFLFNILHNLGNVDDPIRMPLIKPGEPMVLRPEAGVQKLAIIPPRGNRTILGRGNRADFTLADTEYLGIYQMERFLQGEDSRRYLAVNLLDNEESNIDPREQLRLGSETIAAGKKEIHQPRDLWKWVLLLALILLVAEWGLYHRRLAV